MFSSNRSWWRRWIRDAGRKAGGSQVRFPDLRSAIGVQFHRLLLEELEPRVAPTVNLNYDWGSDHSPSSGANLALKVADHGGSSWLQIVDTDSASVAHEVQLTDDVAVSVKGGFKSDTLTVNFSYSGAAAAHAIIVNFQSNTTTTAEAGGVTNSVTVAGSGALYQPTAFSLTSDAPISVTGALTAGSINLSAASTQTLTPAPAALSVNLSPTSTASVTVSSGATVTTSGDLIVSATSVLTLVATAQSQAVGVVNTDAAVALANANSTAHAEIGNATISVSGTLNVSAVNTVTVTMTADGTVGGATGAGASAARSKVNVTTDALIDGAAAINAGAINLSGSSNTAVSTTAKAAQKGAVANGVTPTTAQQLLGTYAPGTANGAQTFAAAVAISDVTNTTTVNIASSGSVQSTGAVTITSQSLTNSTAVGDGRSVNSNQGVGAAVGLNIVNASGTATLSKGLQAPSLTIKSDTPAAQTNNFDAEAYSGAGTTGVGVAGALALNSVGGNKNQATLGSSAAATVTTVSLHASNTSQNTAIADGLGLGNVGVGGSVAIDVAANDTRAAVENGATVSSVNSLSLDAEGNPTMNTTARSGAAGGTATAAAVGLAIPTGTTSAVIGTGSAIALGTPLSVQATHTTSTTTTADGKAAASNVGVGASFGFTIANEASQATVARNVNATTASIGATSTATSATTALASAQGAAPGSTAVNTLIGTWLNFATVTNPWTPSTTLPSAATPDGQVGVAGAIALNVAGPSATASVLSTSTLTLSGALTVQATTQYNASALADSTAVNTTNGVAGAVALNIASPNATATVFGSVTRLRCP
jgi:hypothetical protein